MQSNRLSQIDKALKEAALRLTRVNLSSLMSERKRDRFIYQFEDLIVDCTRQPLDDEAFRCLVDLADECHIHQRIDEMFSGAKINYS